MPADTLPILTNVLGDQSLGGESLDDQSMRYDSFFVPAASAPATTFPLLFFQVPKGQAGSGFATAKWWPETNMRQNGILEYGVEGTVRQIVVEIIPKGLAPADDATVVYCAQLLMDSIVQLNTNQNVEVIDHTVSFAGTGLTGSTTPNAALAQSWVNGAVSVVAALVIDPPTGIPTNTPFTVSLTPNANSVPLQAVTPNALQFSVILVGSFTRPVTQ